MVLDSLHDWNLTGIVWKGETLAFKFSEQHQEPSATVFVELTGIASFRMDGLREGNTVSDAILFDRNNATKHEDDMTYWMKYLLFGDNQEIAPEGESAMNRFVERNRNDILVGNTQCLCIVPAYGATIVVVHRKLKISKRNPD